MVDMSSLLCCNALHSDTSDKAGGFYTQCVSHYVTHTHDTTLTHHTLLHYSLHTLVCVTIHRPCARGLVTHDTNIRRPCTHPLGCWTLNSVYPAHMSRVAQCPAHMNHESCFPMPSIFFWPTSMKFDAGRSAPNIPKIFFLESPNHAHDSSCFPSSHELLYFCLLGSFSV